MSKSSENTNAVRRNVRSIADKIEEMDDSDADGWGGVANVLEQAHHHAKAHAGEAKTKAAVDREFAATGRTDSDRI